MTIDALALELSKKFTEVQSENLAPHKKIQKIYTLSLTGRETLRKAAKTAKQRIDYLLACLHLAKASITYLKSGISSEHVLMCGMCEKELTTAIARLKGEERDIAKISASRKRKSDQIDLPTDSEAAVSDQTKRLCNEEQKVIDNVLSRFILGIESYIKLLDDLSHKNPEAVVKSEELERYSNWLEANNQHEIDRATDIKSLDAIYSCRKGSVIGDYTLVSISRYESYVANELVEAFASLPTEESDSDDQDEIMQTQVDAGVAQYTRKRDELLSKLHEATTDKLDELFKFKVANQEAYHRKIAKLCLFICVNKKQLMPVPTKFIPKKYNPFLLTHDDIEASIPFRVSSGSASAQRI